MSSINSGMPNNQQITLFSMISPVSVCSCIVSGVVACATKRLSLPAYYFLTAFLRYCHPVVLIDY